MDIGIVFVVILAIIVLSIIIYFIYKQRQEDERQEKIRGMSQMGFTKTKEFCGLVIDQEHKKWAVVPDVYTTPYIHDFSDLVDFKLVENGVEYKSSGGVTRALIGGALFGAAGAVVGASTASNKQGVSNMYLAIITNDFDRPTEKIVLWNQPSSPANGALYNTLVNNANELIGLLTAIQANT